MLSPSTENSPMSVCEANPLVHALTPLVSLKLLSMPFNNLLDSIDNIQTFVFLYQIESATSQYSPQFERGYEPSMRKKKKLKLNSCMHT